MACFLPEDFVFKPAGRLERVFSLPLSPMCPQERSRVPWCEPQAVGLF